MSQEVWKVLVLMIGLHHYACAAPSVTVIQNLKQVEDEIVRLTKSDPNFRLSDNFTPETYDIQISNINFNASTFACITTIVGKSNVETDLLIMHSSSLALNGVTIRDLSDLSINLGATIISINSNYETITIKTVTTMKANQTYQILFPMFQGRLDHNMQGFYKSSYTLNSQPVWIGTTQMQPGHARKVFPCFDEPKFKAKFTLNIQRPIGDYTVSFTNTNFNSQEILGYDKFDETPVMSTYLLAFIVSNFKVLAQFNSTLGNAFRVVGRVGAEGQGDYALEEGQKLERQMTTFMGLDYYSMGVKKMDQAAIPDFSAGAMENWGLLTYREAYLLANENTSVRFRQQISGILAHEITHMWFGDYVTCHWWSDAWLNEGFARLFQYKLPDMINNTHNFNMMTQFPVMQLQTAMIADTSIRSPPLTNENVNSPAEVSDHFGTITYNKGASVIRMMEHWVGPENFKQSLNKYMDDNKFGLSTPAKLYTALQGNAGADKNVTQVMSSWVAQSGFPVIEATINYAAKSMVLKQSRMRKPWEVESDAMYYVPISYASKSSANFGDTSLPLLLDTVSKEFQNLNVDGEQWFVLNKQQVGYYRVNYDDRSWEILTDALKGEERTDIHELNRAQIVDDVLNLAREDMMPYNRTMNVLDFLENEVEYAPWQSAIAGFTFIRQQLNTNKRILEKFDEHLLNLLTEVTKSVAITEEGTNLETLFRMNLMNFACSLGHKACVDYAKEAFKNTRIPPDHREFVYCSALRSGGVTEYESLWLRLTRENLVNEQNVIMNALGCTSSKTKIMELLNQLMEPNSVIRTQDTNNVLNSILSSNLDNPEYVLEYLESADNFTKTRTKLKSMSGIFTSLGSRLTGNLISRFYELVMQKSDVLTKEEIAAALTSYYSLAQQGYYVDKAGQEIETWLDIKYDNAVGIAASSLLLLCTMLLSHLFNNKL